MLLKQTETNLKLLKGSGIATLQMHLRKAVTIAIAHRPNTCKLVESNQESHTSR